MTVPLQRRPEARSVGRLSQIAEIVTMIQGEIAGGSAGPVAAVELFVFDDDPIAVGELLAEFVRDGTVPAVRLARLVDALAAHLATVVA